MKYTTELMTFAVKIGKESRASEWMLALQSRQAECVEALEREAMHYESIFRSERDGRMYLSWFSVQGTEGAHVSTSPFEIEKLRTPSSNGLAYGGPLKANVSRHASHSRVA
jgi:hypothetical protein